LIAPGLALARATKSLTVLMPLSGEITSTSGTLPSGVMPARSCTGSYGMCWIAGAVTSELELTRMV
jgi:hypothetical protein